MARHAEPGPHCPPPPSPPGPPWSLSEAPPEMAGPAAFDHVGVPFEECSIVSSSHSLSVRSMRATTLPDAVCRADPLDFADVLLRTDSDLSAIHDYEAKVEAEEESERPPMEWDESMRTLDSLRNSCRSDPEQLQKTESRIGSLLNAAI